MFRTSKLINLDYFFPPSNSLDISEIGEYTMSFDSVAWLIGWALILEYTIGGAAVARGISPNLVW